MAHNFDTAPKDGSVFLIKKESTDGKVFFSSVHWMEYETQPEYSMFVYTDELIQDICPSGPEMPFEWYPTPIIMAVKPKGNY